MDFGYRVWHKTAVPIFVERFLLPVFAAAVVLVAVSNPMGFDRIQRITGSIALLMGAYFLAHTIHKSTATSKVSLLPKTAPTEKPPSLVDLFNKDFPNVLKVTDEAELRRNDGAVARIKRQLYLDFDAKAEFVGFYIFPSTPPSSENTIAICTALSNLVQSTRSDMEKKVEVSGGFQDQMTEMKQLTFSGRVLIYHEDFLSIPQKAEIIKAFSDKGLDVQFRGPEYLAPLMIEWHKQHDAANTS